MCIQLLKNFKLAILLKKTFAKTVSSEVISPLAGTFCIYYFEFKQRTLPCSYSFRFNQLGFCLYVLPFTQFRIVITSKKGDKETGLRRGTQWRWIREGYIGQFNCIIFYLKKRFEINLAKWYSYAHNRGRGKGKASRESCRTSHAQLVVVPWYCYSWLRLRAYDTYRVSLSQQNLSQSHSSGQRNIIVIIFCIKSNCKRLLCM